jgi:hypothetical protein
MSTATSRFKSPQLITKQLATNINTTPRIWCPIPQNKEMWRIANEHGQ